MIWDNINAPTDLELSLNLKDVIVLINIHFKSGTCLPWER